MEILYISSVPSQKEFDRMKSVVKPNVLLTTYGMNESGFKFHTLIMNGITENGHNILSLCGRSAGRSTHAGLFWKKLTEKEGSITHCHLPFINFPILKHIGIGFSFFWNTLCWQIKNRKKECGIIMDASYVSVLPFVHLACLGFKAKKTAIFCDIYDYMASVKDARENENISFVKRVAKKVTAFCYKRTDAYVFLTEQMNEVVNPYGKPYIVMEGLVDINMATKPNELQNKADGKVVMYAGAIRAQYGVKNLIEGFMDYENKDAALWIFGDGDYKTELADVSEKDSRITYFGAVPLKTVIEKELEASLMVNPRPVDKEFTKYSFPSKNMEYMASGTPILTTKLPGMPQDYYDYIYTIDGNSKEDITAALEKALGNSEEELLLMGKKAKEFVLTKKNNVAQSARILALLEV